jgi:hypothetical protein
MKTSLSISIVGMAALVLAQPVQAGSRGGGGRSFSGGAHFSGGSRGYSGGGARYSGGAHHSSGAYSRGSYGGGSRYTAAGGARYTPTTHFRNPTYNTSGRQWTGNRNGRYGGNRTGAFAGNRNGAFNGNHTTAYNSFGRTRNGVNRTNDNSFGRTRNGVNRTNGVRSSAFNPNGRNVIARHSANRHPNWNRHRDHNWKGHRCHFHNGFWYIYDPFPWYGYAYPYSWDYYPYETYYDPGYDSSAYYDDGANQDNRQYSQEPNVSGSRVTDVQRALAREGYYDGAIDGVFGPGTRRALRNYQRDHGLDATGGITQSVIESLRLR